MNCAMCDAMKNKNIVFYEDDLCTAFVLTHPITEFHCLVLPKRHVVELSYLRGDELEAMFNLMDRLSKFIHDKYSGDAIITLNRDTNSTQPHLHFHVVNSVGGVRTLLAPKLGCEIYPHYTEEELEKRAEEYRQFTKDY